MPAPFRCQKCWTIIEIPQRKRQPREQGHIKTMWCWKCKKRQPHRLVTKRG